MSILKKLLHKCSYQLGGKKVTTTSTSPISPVLPKTTDKSEDFIPNVKMQPYVKGNIKDFIMPIPNAKPSNGKPLFVPLPNADPNEKPVMQLLPKKYGKDELPVIYGQFMNVKDYDERNILTQEAIRRGIPIKNNNILKPTTQYKRVGKKDNNVSPRFF